MTQRRRQQSGFVLAMLMVAVVVIAAAAVVGAMVLKDWQTNATAKQLQGRDAAGLVQVADALEQYLSWSGGLWAPGARQVIPISTLYDYGLSPAAVTHGGQAGVSPWMRPYVVTAMMTPQGAQGVVYESGPVSTARRREAGIGAEGLLLASRQVARTLTEKGLVAASLAPGNPVAASPNGGFKVDLGAWIVAPIQYATPVALVGFSNLEPNRPEDDTPEWTSSENQGCDVVEATGSGDAICPAGTQRVLQWPHCGLLNADPTKTTYVAYASQVGTVTVGLRIEDTIEHVRWGTPPWPTPPPERWGYVMSPWWLHPAPYVSERKKYLTVSVNGADLMGVKGLCYSASYGLSYHLDWGGATRDTDCISDAQVRPSQPGTSADWCTLSVGTHDRVSGRDALCCVAQ